MIKFLIVIFLVLSVHLHAQDGRPVKWSYSTKKISATEYDLVFVAKIDKGWHLYSQHIGDGGPVPTSFSFKKNDAFKSVGAVEEKSKADKVHDKSFDMEVIYFKTEAIFIQKIKLEKPLEGIEGSLEYMVCDDSKCLPPETVDFNFKLPK